MINWTSVHAGGELENESSRRRGNMRREARE